MGRPSERGRPARSLRKLGRAGRPRSHLRVLAHCSRNGVPDGIRTGTELGVAHVEASPLTRSSYHAREAVVAAGRGG